MSLFCFVFPYSEPTQCVMIYSRQGTTDTIEEVEDEQDQGEDKGVPRESQQSDEVREGGGEGATWSDGEPREIEQKEEKEEAVEEGQKGLEGEEGLQDEEVPEDQEREEAPWESFGPDEGPSLRVEDTQGAPSAQESDFITESEDEGGQQDLMQTEGHTGLLYTPDTDASKTSDADVPPSYSKAVSFDRLEVSDDESDTDRKRCMAMTSDSHSDSRSDIMLPSMTTELTASELLLNK